jgi:hypothetical protein
MIKLYNVVKAACAKYSPETIINPGKNEVILSHPNCIVRIRIILYNVGLTDLMRVHVNGHPDYSDLGLSEHMHDIVRRWAGVTRLDHRYSRLFLNLKTVSRNSVRNPYNGLTNLISEIYSTNNIPSLSIHNEEESMVEYNFDDIRFKINLNLMYDKIIYVNGFKFLTTISRDQHTTEDMLNLLFPIEVIRELKLKEL